MKDISLSNIKSVFNGSHACHRIHFFLLIITTIFGFQLLQGTEVPPAGSSRVYIQIASNQKDLVVNNIRRSGGVIHYEFDSLGAVAATLPDKAIDALGRSASVLKIEPDPARFLLAESTPWGVAAIQADQLLGSATDGRGVKVGVIDSGIFLEHEEFFDGQDPYLSIAGHPTQIERTIRGGKKPTKELVTLTPDDEEYWARDRDGHGTHVSGTILAAANGKGVVGVAPGVPELFMVKVFGDDGGWIYSSSLLNAVQQAQSAGVRVINMSLGGSVPSSTEQAGMDQAYSQGVLLIAAAGNDGTTGYSYPASYSSVVSVAAIDSSGTVADFSQKNDQVELAAPGVSVLSTVPYVDGVVTVGSDVFHGSTIDFSFQTDAAGISAPLADGGIGDTVDAANLSGKVVLVQRGDISFAEKVQNVQDSGGLAAIIYNNEPGGFLGTLGQGGSSTIPAVSVSDTDGAALLQLLADSQDPLNANVSNFAQIDASGYQSWDGTSMATPHVTGAVALLWSEYPNATAQQIRDALTATALDAGTAGRDTSYGFGIIQVVDALAYLASGGSGGGGGGSGGGGGTGGTTLTISDLTSVITNAKNGSFEISWTTNEAADGKVQIGTGEYYNAELRTSHSFRFRGTKGVSYSYIVTSSNANGTATAPGTHQN